ncbi:hypothetical protein [Halapricum desulfuricans]|uniref:Uncharacterized protein n=1 Tax=Halapricum desulfuricans TaxID=2841257 RepID=A0A897N1A4_9EURY|nr:hypothetical protein [Halapricum desulfuricans]QSG06464.1 Uncharacterized protein HSR121_2133 [Halapricum desulfuricans]
MASMDFGDAFDTLADDDFWIDVAMMFVGFFGSTLAAMAFESVGPDLPNELYGIGVAAGNEVLTDYRMVSVGAGLYSADVAATRVGLKDEVSSMVQGGN